MDSDYPASKVAPLKLHRRQLLQGGAVIAGGAAAGAITSTALASASFKGRWSAWLAQNSDITPASIDDYVPQALTVTEIAVLKAVTGRLIPNDDLGSGAIEAGVFIYIDRLLSGRGATSLSRYKESLAALDEASEGGNFAALSESDQDSVLTSLEAGEIVNAPEGFFRLLLSHTRQGMFSDPIHGGNREFIGWDLIGYPGIKLVWSAEEQQIGAEVKPAHISVEQFGGTPQ